MTCTVLSATLCGTFDRAEQATRAPSLSNEA